MKLKWYPENGKRVLLCKRLGNLIQLIRAWNIFSVTWRSMEEPPFVLGRFNYAYNYCTKCPLP
jgi:hypothetical protein